jgi:hypothetical protein
MRELYWIGNERKGGVQRKQKSKRETRESREQCR